MTLGQSERGHGRGRPAPPPAGDPPFVPAPPVCDPSSAPAASCAPGQVPAWHRLECQWVCEGAGIDPATLVSVVVPESSPVFFDELISEPALEEALLPRGLELTSDPRFIAANQAAGQALLTAPVPGTTEYAAETTQKAALGAGVLYALAKFMFV